MTNTVERLDQRFIDHWCVMSNRWGISEDGAMVHACLLVANHPATAEEIAQRLGSTTDVVQYGLRELADWDLVASKGNGYVAVKEPAEMFKRIVLVRKQREVDPTLEALRNYLTDLEANNQKESESYRVMKGIKTFLDTVDNTFNTMKNIPLGVASAALHSTQKDRDALSSGAASQEAAMAGSDTQRNVLANASTPANPMNATAPYETDAYRSTSYYDATTAGTSASIATDAAYASSEVKDATDVEADFTHDRAHPTEPGRTDFFAALSESFFGPADTDDSRRHVDTSTQTAIRNDRTDALTSVSESERQQRLDESYDRNRAEAKDMARDQQRDADPSKVSYMNPTGSVRDTDPTTRDNTSINNVY